MGVIKTGDYTEPTSASYTSNFMYKYPDKMDLRPGSKLHNLIIQRVMTRAKNSYSAMQRRHKTWNKIDEMMTAYIPLSAEEINTKTKDSTRPVSIIVPYSYANLETILAYQSKAFLSSPIYSYEGVGPEDTVGAKLLELIVNQQARRYKHMLALHTGFRDGLTYGIHASYVTWNTRTGHKVRSTKQPLFDIQGNVIGEEDKKENISTILFEGNRIKNIDPYKYLPDVSVSAENIQDGEFTGWYETENIFNLLTEEASGEIFNIKYVKQELGQGMAKSIFDSDASKRDRFGIRSTQGNSSERNYSVFLTNMYINIIPKDWGLPGSEGNRSGTAPEKWFFLLANDRIVVDARPLGLNHNMFPVAVNAPDYDGYSVAPISRIEMSYGLQEVLNWVFNSHISNIRKALNDMFIVDPSLINMEDMTNPAPGKLIRLRKHAWGRGVEGAVKQFNVQDVTRGNIQDASFVMDLMQKVNSSSDAAMGAARGGERRSAAEFSGTFNSLISRLEHLSSITSTQYLQDIAYLCASHTQQLMTKETYVRAVGDWPEVLMAEFGNAGGTAVSPFDIQAEFDVMYKDGSTMNPDASVLQFWNTMFGAVTKDPELRQSFDIQRIFKHMARMSGAKNVNEFIKQTPMNAQVMPDEVVAQQAQAGNIIPVQ